MNYLLRKSQLARMMADEHAGMDVDTKGSSTSKSKGRVEKKRSARSKASIVFPKYKSGKKVGTTRRKR
jgi:hypothetical protein